MSQSLKGAIAALQTIVGGLSGIRNAPELAPEQLNEFPIAVAYPSKGEIFSQSGVWRKSLHTIALEIHTARKDLPTDISRTINYVELVGDALVTNPTLGGAVDSIVFPLKYGYGELEWVGDVITLGYQFLITVKINQAVE